MRLVLALTGTDHHPFDRLVGWMDAAAAERHDVRFVVQHGMSAAPRVAEGLDFVDHARLVELVGAASVVVCHGGPGTIMDAREAGHVPLCVPRDPGQGEHVDGHQQRFAAQVGAAGLVRDIRTAASFQHELALALLRPRTGLPSMANELRDAARVQASAELDALMLTGRPHLLGRRRSHARV